MPEQRGHDLDRDAIAQPPGRSPVPEPVGIERDPGPGPQPQDEVTETPSANGTPVYLHARGVRSGIAVSVTATVFDGEQDSR